MPDPDAPVARVLQQRLRDQVEALRAADAGLGSGDPDSVHDVRVASRRLRACLGSFGKAFDTGRQRAPSGGAALARPEPGCDT